MISQLKTFILNLLAGANIVVVLLMLISGFSDRISPADNELLACSGIIFPFIVLANVLFIPVWVFLSWKRLAIPVIGLALAYIPIRTYLPLHGKSTPPEGSVCIVSYNVAGYGGNNKYSNAFDTIFNYVKTVRPDILCLQEEQIAKDIDTHRFFAELFPYNDSTRVSDVGGPWGLNSVGIHSRYPILRKEIIPYDSPTNGSVAYFLKIGTDTVIVINNHLETSHLSSDDRNRYEEIYSEMLKGDMERDTLKAETSVIVRKLSEGMVARAAHVEIIHNYMEAHRRYPMIVCGDFNDTPISYTRHIISQDMTDCFVESGRGFGISYNRKGFNLRIDHMMCSSHFTPYACKIDNEMDASDHYPLLCWLKFNDLSNKTAEKP